MSMKLNTEYNIYSTADMKHLKTRQLLAELRRTHTYGCPYTWEDEDWEVLHTYRAALKAELATREHIPNKQESKAIRKARIKKGR